MQVNESDPRQLADFGGDGSCRAIPSYACASRDQNHHKIAPGKRQTTCKCYRKKPTTSFDTHEIWQGVCTRTSQLVDTQSKERKRSHITDFSRDGSCTPTHTNNRRPCACKHYGGGRGADCLFRPACADLCVPVRWLLSKDSSVSTVSRPISLGMGPEEQRTAHTKKTVTQEI